MKIRVVIGVLLVLLIGAAVYLWNVDNAISKNPPSFLKEHQSYEFWRTQARTMIALVIEIRDDGKGMVVKDLHSDVDFGLLGMRERAQSLGGEFQLISEPGHGVKIRVIIPLRTDRLL